MQETRVKTNKTNQRKKKNNNIETSKITTKQVSSKMKRYSIIPTSSRRKSGVNVTASDSALPARQILDQLDQDTTFVLQEIDKNISRATAVINDKIIPMLQEYDAQSSKVWENTGFWKHFLSNQRMLNWIVMPNQ